MHVQEHAPSTSVSARGCLLLRSVRPRRHTAPPTHASPRAPHASSEENASEHVRTQMRSCVWAAHWPATDAKRPSPWSSGSCDHVTSRIQSRIPWNRMHGAAAPRGCKRVCSTVSCQSLPVRRKEGSAPRGPPALTPNAAGARRAGAPWTLRQSLGRHVELCGQLALLRAVLQQLLLEVLACPRRPCTASPLLPHARERVPRNPGDRGTGMFRN